MEVKVLSQQSFYDISIQYTGTVDNAFEIAYRNKRSTSDKLTTGELLQLPSTLIKDEKVLQYYKARNIVPATGNLNLTAPLDYRFPQGEFPISL